MLPGTAGELAVILEVFLGDLVRLDEHVVALVEDLGPPPTGLFEGEERDLLAADELRGNGAADAVRELGLAHCDVLLDLHDAVAVVATFGLHREDVVRALTVDADVDL